VNKSLLTQQQNLQSDAHKLIEKLDLINVLSIIGKPVLVGSAAVGLMTWKDIDFSVVVNEFDENTYWEAIQKLYSKPTVFDMTIYDTRTNTGDYATGMYIGIRCYLKDITDPLAKFNEKKNSWKIDVWITKPGGAFGVEKSEWIKSRLNEEKRNAILEIKNVVSKNPKYRNEITSMDIYTAVLEENIKDLKGFKTYLSTAGKQL